jgi:CubicO group peptidase (beta-lactamase class C family)
MTPYDSFMWSRTLFAAEENSAVLESYLAAQSTQGRFCGAALVVQDECILLDKGYGVADYTSNRPITSRTIFQIASVSKQFAAAAVLLLQERGKLSVADHVSRWLSECPRAWEPITLHHLLTHTSGIGHWRDYPKLNTSAAIDRRHLLRLVSELPLKFAPSEGWAYSSPGYVLLALIVEQAAGEPYNRFLEQQIFTPLVMSDTTVGLIHSQNERRANGYSRGEPVQSMNLDTIIGAGDVWSTTHDVQIWDEALASPGRLLGKASLDSMFTPYAIIPKSFADDAVLHYGYACFIGDIERHRVRFHTGDNPGFRAINVQLPDLNAIIVLLSNEERIDVNSIGLYLATELARGPSGSAAPR